MWWSKRGQRAGLIGALTGALLTGALLTGCGGGQSATTSDPAAARALYDRAVVTEFSGDTLGAEDLMFELATRHPDTPHGRAARARLASSGSLPVAAGIIAAAAVPAFMRYSNRSKPVEANTHLQRIGEGARAYYSMERADPDGRILPAGLPASAPPTPARPHCEGGGDAAFDPRPGDWDHPTWQALNFAVVEPHDYQYSFTAEGEGADATFVARAVGDLDCDGVFSTFELRGRIVDGEVALDWISSSDPLE